MRKLFIALLSALLCLLLSVSALAADGLSTFQETQTYQPGMFSDVKAGSWYEAGVRAVYTRGIMNGTGGKAFAPSRQHGPQAAPLPRASTPPARRGNRRRGGSVVRAVPRLCRAGKAAAVHLPGGRRRRVNDHHPSGAGRAVRQRAARGRPAPAQRSEHP